MAALSIIENLIKLLLDVVERIKKDTRFLKTIMFCFIIAGTGIFIYLFIKYYTDLGNLSAPLLGIGTSMFTTSVISYLFQIRKNNNRIATLNSMNQQIRSVEESHDEESTKTVNDIYKTVFGKLIIDNLN
jgi:hypothetical protein